MSEHGGEEPHVVVRDRRRIDPQTGEVRPPEVDDEESSTGRHAAEDGESPAAAPADDAGSEDDVRKQLEERTADLQRLTAEYANYRKRVERDRELAAGNAKAMLVGQLLSVLDDIERADAHGDLTGAFKTVADKLAATLQRSGLTAFGEPDEPFDPSVHEAVQHDTSPDVAGPTVSAVLRRGYRFGDRVVRAALVAVTDYEAPAGASDEVSESAGTEQD
ncbi:MAG TPA: nucleotide exchange factor GrpE [Pseudonocardiaceae bacterium]|jgi:molecular chaperone GrpE|nr:nucleotide exchange factor GrpE [Pseudonocardiaceae bacterium]